MIGADIFIGCFPNGPDNCLALLHYESAGENRLMEIPDLRLAARWKEDYLYAPHKLTEAHRALKRIGFGESGAGPVGIAINGRRYTAVYPAPGGLEPMEPDDRGRMCVSKSYYVAKG